MVPELWLRSIYFFERQSGRERKEGRRERLIFPTTGSPSKCPQQPGAVIPTESLDPWSQTQQHDKLLSEGSVRSVPVNSCLLSCPWLSRRDSPEVAGVWLGSKGSLLLGPQQMPNETLWCAKHHWSPCRKRERHSNDDRAYLSEAGIPVGSL